MSVAQNICERPRLGREEPKEIELSEVADRERFRRESPVLIVEEDRADRGFVLLQEVLHVHRVTPRGDIRELSEVPEAWEL